MEQNFNLYKHIIEVVDTQIKENNPPFVKETYDRLIENGDDESTAKEKIASVIAEEIYIYLKEEKKVNEERYAEKLSQLA